MEKSYLLTISQVIVKESPSRDDLFLVMYHVRQGLTGNIFVREWVYEIGPKYHRRHIHAIVELKGRYKGFTSHIHGNKLYQIRWDLLRTPLDVKRARLYIRKDDPDIFTG